MATSLRDSGAVWIDETFLPDSQALFATLAGTVAWDERMKARKAASFGLPYNYSGVTWPAFPFPDVLLAVLQRVAARLGYRPNNCLAHYYPDGDSNMGFHSDATDDLVMGTGIAVVSLGAERSITFRNQHDRQALEHYPLKSGSLLYMTPEMQVDWKHAILPVRDSVGGRISLTFRCMKCA
jgi:alkylated DNA repair dioxygenase AlkB